MRHSDDAHVPVPAGPEPTGLPAPAGERGPRQPGALARWQGATIALLSGAILFGACQGDNLFSGNSETLQPKIVGIATPAQIFPGDTLQVQVSAYGARQIARVQIMLSGAIALDTSVDLDQPAVSVAQNFRIPLPLFLADTTLIIRALAYDKVGAVSRQRVDTAKAVAPPAVIEFAGPDSVRAGTTLRLALHAVGVRPVSKIRVHFSGAISRQDSIVVAMPRKDVTDTLSFPVAPEDVVDTTLTIDMQAVDNSGLAGYTVRGSLPVAIPAPSIILVSAPNSVSAGGTLDLTVQARGLRNITRILYQLRGVVPAIDSSKAVTVPGRNITQSASFTIPANTQDSVLRLTITAMDVAGSLSSPWEGSVSIPTGTPVVESLEFPLQPDSVRPGTRLDARVVASGPRQITRIDLSLRGAFENDYSHTIAQPSTSVTEDFAVQLPDTSRDSMLVVVAKATDAAGKVSPLVQRVLRVSDTAPPTVTATLSASRIAAGRDVLVHLVAKDNVGLSLVGVRLLNARDTLILEHMAAAAGRSCDTTFTIRVPMSGPTTLSVVGYARDRSNHETVTPKLPLIVVDSAAPVTEITSPADGASVPIGDSLRVTVHAADAVGIRSIELSGIAIRQSPYTDPVIVQRFQTRTLTFPQPTAQGMPRDTSVTRFLLPTADTTSEQVRIIALVTDSVGNTAADTAYVNVGGPRVEIRTPVSGGPPATVGLPLQVRLFAQDRGSKIDSVRLEVTGALTQTITYSKAMLPSPSDSVLLDTTVTPLATGTITLNATAWNGNGIVGHAPTAVSVNVVGSGAGDVYRPFVHVTSLRYRNADLADPNTRVELTDSIAVHVQASDNGSSGVRRVGITVLAVPSPAIAGLAPETMQVKFATPRTGAVDTTFYVVPRLFGLNEMNGGLGALLSTQLQIHTFAVDGQGNCGASVSLGTSLNFTASDSLPCDYGYSNAVPDTFFVASGRTGLTRTVRLVGGKSVGLPGGGNIADAVVDPGHEQLYLSNITANKVDVLKLTDTTFIATGAATGLGLVGSQPWGLFLNGGGDSLFVANSGGTNLSVVALNAGNPSTYLREDTARRVFTPNEVLFQVKTSVSAGFIRYEASFYDFSDRPQFIAQDQMGRLVYSTVPTGSAPNGTLRYVTPRPAGFVLEPKLLFNGTAITPGTDATAIAYADLVTVIPGGSGDDVVRIYDHIPGDTSVAGRIVSPPLPLAAALAYMQSNGSDIQYFAGNWDVTRIGMSDTTFMGAAGDRSKIAFGEGATPGSGRIMVWDGTVPLGSETVSNAIAVQDLVNNASERVFGLGMNANGSLGVARGEDGAYFFTPDLRLQGIFSTPGGAGGAAMHPQNNSPLDQAHGLAFVSTPDHAIKILDSVHFYERGEIKLRDNVVGPVKAGLPLPGENGALAPSDPNYILVKLYAVTGYSDATGAHTQVVIVNVRNKDLSM